MPEIKLPGVRLPKGLREMTVDDIQRAFSEVRLRNLDLALGRERRRGADRPGGVELPRALTRQIERGAEQVEHGVERIERGAEQLAHEISKVDLSKLDLSGLPLPAAVEARLPGRRRRRNPLVLLLVGALAIGAAAWLVLASPLAPRIRSAIDDVRARLGMGGGHDDEEELDDVGSGAQSGRTGIDVYESATPGMVSEVREPVGVGPGPVAAGPGATAGSTEGEPGDRGPSEQAATDAASADQASTAPMTGAVGSAAAGPGPGSDPFRQSTSDAPSTDLWREPERTEPTA